MVWLLFPFSVLLILLMYILLAPIYIDIDSTKGLYRIRFHLIASVAASFGDKTLLTIKLLGWKKRIDLSDPVLYKQEKHSGPGKPVSKKYGIKLSNILSVLKSFKIKTCDISFDSYNMQLNGILFPLFYFGGCYFKKSIRISFTGENHIILQMQNKLGRMAAAYLWPS
jgi:hypothetical protein